MLVIQRILSRRGLSKIAGWQLPMLLENLTDIFWKMKPEIRYIRNEQNNIGNHSYNKTGFEGGQRAFIYFLLDHV